MKKAGTIFVTLLAVLIEFVLLLSLSSCSEKNTIAPVKEIESIKIGSQIWMRTNLDVDHYRNGDPIPQVTDPEEWSKLTTGAWCYYNNDPAMGAIYGKIYNWYAIKDQRGLLESGWRVPNESDWAKLTSFLNGGNVAGGKLKEQGTVHWYYPNNNASNLTGFSALPGGYRSFDGIFVGLGSNADFWCYSNEASSGAWDMYLHNDNDYLSKDSIYKSDGFSVRLVKDNDIK
jgi:uncharacterized protein (TIGR02145 family)